MSDQRVGRVFIISPRDEEGEPMKLFFTVTDGGLLLHMENMSQGEIPKEVVSAEIGKLLNGLDSADGRYNEFIKNSSNYKIRQGIEGIPLTVADARKMDSMYRMSKEERIRAIEKEKELWMR